jgi:AAA-like domain
VGVPIELPLFSQGQLADLAVRHGLEWSALELNSLMVMVGGHPYLTRLALQKIASGAVTLTDFLQVAPTQEWVLRNHLGRHLETLERQNLVKFMKQVIVSDKPVRLPISEASKLSSMGLIRFQGNDAIVLCDLYRQYFREVLGAVR